jgi:hypothetical protein
MSSPGMELLVRLVAQQLEARSCTRCGRSLAGSQITLREHDAAQVVIEVGCRACDEPLLLRVEPEADDGVARVG